MARWRDYGESPETPIKHEHFRGLLAMHLRTCKNLVTDACPYQYLDLNAGPGIFDVPPEQPMLWEASEPGMRVQIKGSPVIFTETVKAAGIPYRAILFEKDPAYRAALQACLNGQANITIAGDHDTAPDYLCTCSRCHRHAQGLIYSDESGHIPPFGLFAQLTDPIRCRRLDLLIYYSATLHKRARRLFRTDRLTDYLACIPKRYWLVREPRAQEQWTFLIGTNWSGFPTWERQGFHRTDQPRGAEILRTINLTASEMKDEEHADESTRVPLLSGVLAASQVPGRAGGSNAAG